VLEHDSVEGWNINDREGDDKTGKDGPEQELVAPESVKNAERSLMTGGIEVEQGAGEMLDFPSCKKQEEG